MSNEVEKGKDKAPRKRSPNFPSISLKDAVEKTRILFLAASTHKVSLEKTAQIWDYSTKSSSFLKCIGALKAFGLIDIAGSGDQRQIGVSLGGEQIVDRGPEAEAMLRKAALRPRLYQEVVQKYVKDGQLPNSDILKDKIRWDKELDFNKATIDEFIKTMLETFDYAKPNLSAKIESTEDDDSDDGDERETPPHGEKPKDRVPPRRQLEGNMKEFTFPLPSGTVATVQVPHPMEKDDFDTFMEFLGVYEKAMVKKDVSQTAGGIPVAPDYLERAKYAQMAKENPPSE